METDFGWYSGLPDAITAAGSARIPSPGIQMADFRLQKQRRGRTCRFNREESAGLNIKDSDLVSA